MNENQRTMEPDGYLREFKQTLSILFDRQTPQSLFKEWPIDIKHYRDKKHEPIYTQEAKIFMEYSIKPKDYLDSIKSIGRTESYKLSHDGKQDFRKDGKCTTEKVEAKALYNSFKGKKDPFSIIAYEVPLRKSSNDKGIGEIDLLGQKGDIVYLLELKKFKDPNGALFHMILQSYTYLRLLNLERFKQDYKCKIVIPAIIFFRDSENYKQFYDPRNKVFKQLLRHLGMKVFSIESLDKPYTTDTDIYIKSTYPKLKSDIRIKELDLSE